MTCVIESVKYGSFITNNRYYCKTHGCKFQSAHLIEECPASKWNLPSTGLKEDYTK